MKRTMLWSSVALSLAVTTVAAAAQTAVKIGVLADMSGPYSDFAGPGSVEAVKMAVEDFRAVNRTLAIEVVSADGQNKPDIATTIARRWFDTEKVDMVIDVPTSGIALPLAAIAKEKNKVMIATTAGTSEFSEKPARRTAFIGPGTLGRIHTAPPRRS